MNRYALADSGGTTWYFFIDTDGEPVLSTDDPAPSTAEWNKCSYNKYDDLDVNTADSGIKYLEFENTEGTTMYLYPNTNGSIILTDTEPT